MFNKDANTELGASLFGTNHTGTVELDPVTEYQNSLEMAES